MKVLKKKMKTKYKIMALIEIAVVLCSVFLATIPAIVAEQNSQKMNASTNTITTASEDDYVLGVYGNANEDDTIDMRDLTYVKLIFFGKKPETELADAKYDGKINPLDFIQIKLIIVGKEKELTIVDAADRIVTVKKPVQRVIALADVEVFEVIKGQDKIVGVYDQILTDKMFPGWSEVPGVGRIYNSDCEAMLNLNPDLVVTWESVAPRLDEKLPDSITVVGLYLAEPETLIDHMVKLGYILDKKDEMEHYLDDFHDKYIDLIKARTKKLSEEERPTVYTERFFGGGPYKTYGGKTSYPYMFTKAGGRFMFADIEQGWLDVDPEEVVMRNPDIIIKHIRPMDVEYDEDIFKVEAARQRNEILNRPELANVNAVKNERVYIFDAELTVGPTYPIAIAYWAKLLHPDLFEDLDLKTIHREYLTEYKGVDLDLLPFDMDDEIWIYPHLE